jgi:hypothetical protein
MSLARFWVVIPTSKIPLRLHAHASSILRCFVDLASPGWDIETNQQMVSCRSKSTIDHPTIEQGKAHAILTRRALEHHA